MFLFSLFSSIRKHRIRLIIALILVFLIFHFVVTFSEDTLETYKNVINSASNKVIDHTNTVVEHLPQKLFDDDSNDENAKLKQDNERLKEDLNSAKTQAERLSSLNKETHEVIAQREKELQAKISELQVQHDKLLDEKNQFLKASFNQLSSSKASKFITLDDYELKDSQDIDISKGDKLFHNFFQKFFKVLKDNQISITHPERQTIERGKPIIWRVQLLESPDYTMSENEIRDLLDFPDDFVEDLIPKHKAVVESIPPLPPVKFYKGSGYTMVGGGIYSWYAYLSIKSLREVGSILPVEVILPDDSDFEKYYCEQLLPEINAKCVMLSTVFGKETMKTFELSGYQFKSFALLASSFENTFLLDSDSFAVKNPDGLFESELYQTFGMITWPDFWRRTTSPYYYKVAGLEVGDKPIRRMNDLFTDPKLYYSKENLDNLQSEVAYHDRQGTIPDWTSESGELLIRKSTHFDVLLLSLYYNFDGPSGYSPLLSQGGAGEGDKETFVAAAHFYNKPYYQLYKAPDRLGEWFKQEKNTREHTTIVQYDPIIDFDILRETIARMQRDTNKDGDAYDYVYTQSYRFPWGKHNVDPMFYHIHDPKLDPFLIMSKGVTEDEEKNQIRNIGDEFGYVGYDVELQIYKDMKEALCEKKHKFEAFLEKNFAVFCDEFIDKRIEFLESTSKVLLEQSRTNRKVEAEALYDKDEIDHDLKLSTKEVFDRFRKDVQAVKNEDVQKLDDAIAELMKEDDNVAKPKEKANNDN